MTTKRKLVICVAFILVLSLGLLGCAASNESSKNSTTAEATTSTAAAAEDPAIPASHDLVESWEQSAHAKAYRKEFYTSKNDGGYAELGCYFECHSAKVITGEIEVTPDLYARFMDGGDLANDREGITCRGCHTLDSTGISLRLTEWETCGSCHNMEGRKDGQKVNHPQSEMIFGVDLNEVKIKAASHSTSLESCIDCHTTNENKHDFKVEEDYVTMYSQEKCQSCHADAQTMADQLTQDQQEITDRLEEYRPVWSAQYKVFSKYISDGTGQPKPGVEIPEELVPFIEDFKHVVTKFRIVDDDRSHGAHNMTAAKDLLDFAEPELDEIQTKYQDILAKYQ